MIKLSGWGDFVLFTEKDFTQYEEFKRNLPNDLFILDCTLEYFLNMFVKQKVDVLYYTECIVRLIPSDVSDQYRNWLEEIKCRLLDSSE